MKKSFLFLTTSLLLFSCQTEPQLSDKEKLALLKVGMPLEEVMKIYGLKDTIGKTTQTGIGGYVMDSVTEELITGPDGLSPMIMIQFDSNNFHTFINGKLLFVPEMTGEEFNKKYSSDSLINAIN